MGNQLVLPSCNRSNETNWWNISASLYSDIKVLGLNACFNVAQQQNDTKEWKDTKQTLTDFPVAGVNLAAYKMPYFGNIEQLKVEQEPFKLYKDFDIGHLITGGEGWDELIAYHNALERPNLSFYVDKVAQKRWLPTLGYKIPRPLVCSAVCI
jgi:hypothetical protein